MNPFAHPSAAVVDSAAALGGIARSRRESLGLGLREAAPAAGVGPRFLSEFERGKPTAEVGKALAALHSIGLDLAVVPRPASEAPAEGGYSKQLNTEFPYDWSNSRMPAGLFIRKVLRARRFDDVLKTVGHFGIERVAGELSALGDPAAIEKAVDVLARIYKGMLLAQSEVMAKEPDAAS
jgi:transcriptional regulator with XRE-family HTH domain